MEKRILQKKKTTRSKNIIKAVSELFDIYRVYHTSDRVEQWKLFKIFQHVIQKYYSDDHKEAVNHFKKFLNDYSTSEKTLPNGNKK